jgi:TRAP-type C4-dicarboxylate transport system permease small subunit
MAFTEDISMLMFMWLIFFASAQCYTDNSHLGLPLLYEKLNWKGRIVFSTIVFVISFIFYGFVFYTTGALAMNQLRMHVKTGMGFPAIIGGSALPIGSVAVVLQLVKSYIRNIKILISEKNA